MELDEANKVVDALKKLESRHAQVLIRTITILLKCCKDGSDVGAVLVMRTPEDDDNWMLHVQALNLDVDDTYLALVKAACQVAEHIKAEAPPSEYLN